MNARYFIPGLLWFCAMVLLLFTPQNNPENFFFGTIPSVSFLHGILFLGFVHIWTGACKKQLTYGLLRNRAMYLVFGVAVVIAILSVLCTFLYGVFIKYCLWNLLFDLTGASLGILTFKLLYRKCY